MEQHPTQLAAIGILTQRPSGALERDMWAAYERHASRRVLLRHCVFEDEARERGPAIVVLQRPSYAPWAQLQCVAKILQWLRHAVDERLGRFVGWFDSDTWMHPQRLAAHLSRVQQAVPRGADVWAGFWEHWERAAWDQPGPPKSLGGVGFSYSPLGPVTAHKETDPAMRARSRAERRRFSFGMTQGGWTYFSAAAAARLVQHVLRRGAATFGFAVAGDGARLPPTRPGVCSMVTDVGIGWLGAQAFDGVALHAVSAHHMLETFTYPVYSRFNPRHALAVHGLKTLGARSWFEERMDNATHVPPLIECAPANWAHARAAAWSVCASVAPCDDEGVVLDPTLEQLRNMSVPWLPVSVRELCKARRKRTAAAETAAGK